MNQNYLPTHDSLAGRVCAWFAKASDDDEVLSSADIVLKFDANAASVGALLAPAVTAGLLKRHAGVYSAGPHIGRVAPDRHAEPAESAKARRRATPPPPIDPTAVTLHEDVPLPQRAGSQALAWGALLERMKPGQATAVLSLAYKTIAKNAIKTHATAGKAGKFTVAAISDTQMRIWRTE